MTIKDTILESCELPAVPMVALKIQRLVNSPNADIRELQEAILADQAFAARVIRMANSAFYGLTRKVENVTDAILVMGFATIKNLALAVSTKEVYKHFGLLEKKMWEHSIGVSVASGLIAREARFVKPEEAVIAGLMHDIGKVVMNNSHPERFMHLTQRVYEERVTYASIEKEIFGFGHAEVGAIFAEKWEFPPLFCDVIRMHHSCEELVAKPFEDQNMNTLCFIIALGDAICLKLGVGYRGPMEELALGEEKWSRKLGISEQRGPELIEEFKQAYVKEKMLFQ